MWHGIVAVSEPSRISYVRMEGSFVPPRSDGCEGGLAIYGISPALFRVGRRGEIFPRYPSWVACDTDSIDTRRLL